MGFTQKTAKRETKARRGDGKYLRLYESHRKSEDDEMMFDEKRWVTERVTREGWVSLKIPRGDIDGLGEEGKRP